MQILEDIVERIFIIMDLHWNSQSWENLTSAEYAEAICLRVKVDEVSNLLKQGTGKDLGITTKHKIILANYLEWYEGLF